MRSLALGIAAALGLSSCARPTVEVTWVENNPETPESIVDARLMKVAHGYDFEGEYLVSRGGDSWGFSNLSPKSPRVWRWASVTKQVIATLVMQEVAKGRIELDKPMSTYLPRFASPNAGRATVRQLLRHQSGLPNPDDTAATPDSVPAYDAPGYTGNRNPLTGYCAGPVKSEPGGNWEYNNCDYIVAGALLQAVTGKNWRSLVRDRISRPFGLESVGAYPTRLPTVAGLVNGKPEPAYDLGAFEASAGLYGSVEDLWKFDRALMTGKILPSSALREMWDGQARLGSIALGQWAFDAQLKGCPKPTRIIERRGQIGGVEVRNLIAPERDVVVIAFVNRSGFDYGEIWQGKGFSFDLLSAVACP